MAYYALLGIHVDQITNQSYQSLMDIDPQNGIKTCVFLVKLFSLNFVYVIFKLTKTFLNFGEKIFLLILSSLEVYNYIKALLSQDNRFVYCVTPVVLILTYVIENKICIYLDHECIL